MRMEEEEGQRAMESVPKDWTEREEVVEAN